MKWISLLCLALSTSALPAQNEWSQFLGPQRSGVATEQVHLMNKFADDGPIILWKYSCGSGFAGPVVSGGQVFLFHRVKDEARLDALDLKTGKQAWTFSYATDYRDNFGFDDGPRACPTVANGKVFLYGAEGMMHVVDAKTGKLLWKRDLAADYESEQGFFGRAGAPLVVGNLVIVSPGGPKGSVVGLGVADGATKWTAGTQAAGYASPIVWQAEGKNEVILCLLREGILGMDAKSGKVLFETPYRARMEASVNAATPLVISPTEIFTTASYGTGAALWKYSAQKWTSVWKAGNKLDCHYATPVFADGFLYGMHGRQEQGQELRCLEVATGKLKWSSPQMAAGECISADGKLIVITDRGELLLVAQNAEKFTVLDRGQILSAGHRSPPALAGGTLLARDKEKLVAVKLSE